MKNKVVAAARLSKPKALQYNRGRYHDFTDSPDEFHFFQFRSALPVFGHPGFCDL